MRLNLDLIGWVRVRELQVCGEASRASECLQGHGRRAYGNGWALAIPIMGIRLGSTLPGTHPVYPSPVPAMAAPTDRHRDARVHRSGMPLGHAHMTVLDCSKEILGVECAQAPGVH